MGIIKVIQNTKSTGNYLFNALNYIKRDAVAYSGYRVDSDNAYEQMMIVKKYFGKTSGNQLMHFIISFNENFDDPKECMKYAYRFAKYFGNRFQVCYALHFKIACDDNGVVKSFYHLHMILNSVSYVDGKMFSDGKDSINKFMEYVSKIIDDMFISVIYSKYDRSCRY